MFFVLFILLFICCAEGAPGDRVTVNISDGALSGIELATNNRSIPFWAFLGIPYAAPPIGDLRFREPQPVKPWSGVRDASFERNICMQINATGTSEDCLFVNVYTTVRLGTESAPLPVMVWIHGGAFYFGSGNLGQHGTDLLLENGVIVVSLNYRLDIFGFLCTLDPASPGNYGLKDQIAALKWVQNNIDKFGGDPKRVTIFGHSAGSGSVVYLLQSNLTKGLYSAAIAQSGSTLNPWSPTQHPRERAFRIGASNLIFTFDSNDLVRRLRRVNANNLLRSSILSNIDLPDAVNGIAWAPCLESVRPDAVVTTYSYPLLESGNFNQVPFMTGFASLEARDTNRLQWLPNLFNVQYTLYPSSLVPKDMNAVDRDAAGREIRQFYFNNQPVGNNTNFVRYQSDNLFVRGINKHVSLMSKHVPVYYYRFAYTGGSQHKKFDPEGASHGEEIQFLFNDNQTTAEAKLTQTRVVKLWTNFAKFYDPTYDADVALSNLSWNAVGSNNSSRLLYLNIDKDLTIGENPEEKQMQFWDKLYTKYGFQPYNSY